MKIGLFTVLFSDRRLTDILDYLSRIGIEAVELGTGNYPGEAHCSLDMLDNDAKLKDFKKSIEDRDLVISALSTHGNPLHPNRDLASQFIENSRRTILMAEKLGVEVVIDFSGCPGDCETAEYPNWVTYTWPPDYGEILKWQWAEKVVPFWKQHSVFARDHGVNIALEMHPGFVVYNPETLLRLRQQAGDNIGANFDPSHLFWQGIDPVAAVKMLHGAIYHVHAKDTYIDPYNSAINGNLDTKPYSELPRRSWIFRTVGYGHDFSFWKAFISTLRTVGYDHVLSIEHEDPLMSKKEGLEKAVQFLKQAVISQPATQKQWTQNKESKKQ